MTAPRTFAFTLLSLVAFAANSLLAREALSGEGMDGTSFTFVRLASGALMLWMVLGIRRYRQGSQPSASPKTFTRGHWLSASCLFAYALFFSWAYRSLDAGTGTLILFGAVQVTMMGWGLRTGERPESRQWVGLVLAVAGLVYLLAPGLQAPDPVGALWMTIAGIAWGAYSLRGRGLPDPTGATAGNFLRAVPLGLAALALANGLNLPSSRGLLLATLSGAVTSGLGYVIWYRALSDLTPTSAAIVQLSVPVLAALGGVALLGESLSLRLALAGGVILFGVALAISKSSK